MTPEAGQEQGTWREKLEWIAAQAHSACVASAAFSGGIRYHDNKDINVCNGPSCKRWQALQPILNALEADRTLAVDLAEALAAKCPWCRDQGQEGVEDRGYEVWTGSRADIGVPRRASHGYKECQLSDDEAALLARAKALCPVHGQPAAAIRAILDDAKYGIAEEARQGFEGIAAGNSRSVQRRKAAQRGEPAPEFEPAAADWQRVTQQVTDLARKVAQAASPLSPTPEQNEWQRHATSKGMRWLTPEGADITSDELLPILNTLTRSLAEAASARDGWWKQACEDAAREVAATTRAEAAEAALKVAEGKAALADWWAECATAGGDTARATEVAMWLDVLDNMRDSDDRNMQADIRDWLARYDSLHS